MANPEHLAKFNEGNKAWNEWREANPDIHPDLSGADLEDRIISTFGGLSVLLQSVYGPSYKINLSRVIFDDANLKGSVIGQADFRGATLNRTKCGKASFLHSNFTSASMCNVNFTDANLHSSILNRTVLIKATLDNAQLGSAKIKSSSLNQASLRKADLLGADLAGSSLAGADLTDARLQQANLRNANVAGVLYSRDSRQSNFLGIRVSECHGDQIFKTFAQDQDYIENFRVTKHWVWFWLWYIFSDCGRSFFRWALWSGLFVSIFWLVYCIMLLPCYGLALTDAPFVSTNNLDLNPLTLLYFSVVVFTTLGFGDIAAKTTVGAFVVLIEVITGYVMLGGLVAILANKLARRS